MNVVVVGASGSAFLLCELLLEEKNIVVVIDSNKEVCEKISSELGVKTINGDATIATVLEQAVQSDTDCLVALTSFEEKNMVIALLAKELGAKSVGVRVSKADFDEVALKRIGIDFIVFPELAAAGYLFETIKRPQNTKQ